MSKILEKTVNHKTVLHTTEGVFEIEVCTDERGERIQVTFTPFIRFLRDNLQVLGKAGGPIEIHASEWKAVLNPRVLREVKKIAVDKNLFTVVKVVIPALEFTASEFRKC
jgi:hypothetical protein